MPIPLIAPLLAGGAATGGAAAAGGAAASAGGATAAATVGRLAVGAAGKFGGRALTGYAVGRLTGRGQQDSDQQGQQNQRPSFSEMSASAADAYSSLIQPVQFTPR